MGVVARGQIWCADLGSPSGSEPGYRRPVAIISSDRYNRSRIRTVTVVAITSNIVLGSQPGNVLLPADLLPKPSVVNVTALFTLDRDRLIDQITELGALEQQAVDDGLRLALHL